MISLVGWPKLVESFFFFFSRPSLIGEHPQASSDRCMCMQGYCPPVQAALEVFQLLSEPGVDLRQPVRLEKQLLKDQSNMDTEVGASMLQLLQVQL